MPTDETYCVRITKDNLVFSSAHFITFNGNICERLHGHNYRVAAKVWATLDENGYVFDFIALRDMLGEITDRLDHRVILPERSSLIGVTVTDSQVEARFEQRKWRFPREDCFLLPITNTTAEQLARWIAAELAGKLKRDRNFLPDVLEVEVEECFGQSATYRWSHSEIDPS